MKTKVKTTILQEMVSKAVKGASCNRMIPITGLIEIKVNDGVLSLTTTDATNTLILSKKDIPGDDFYAVVPIDIFSKLVAKTTAEYISLAVDDGILEITGNGSYRMDRFLRQVLRFLSMQLLSSVFWRLTRHRWPRQWKFLA